MAVQSFNNPHRKKGFFSWKRQVFITIILLILLGLIWFVYDARQSLSPVVKPMETPATTEHTLQRPEAEGDARETDVLEVKPLPKPLPKALNLNIVPIEPSNKLGPQKIVDELEKGPINKDDGTSSVAQENATELNYGYKGHDEQGVNLELGASEKSMQIKFGVQAGDKKVNVNSIEVEIPLSK